MRKLSAIRMAPPLQLAAMGVWTLALLFPLFRPRPAPVAVRRAVSPPAVFASSSPSGPRYRLTDLGVNVNPTCINDIGQIAGEREGSAFVLNKGKFATINPLFGDTTSEATAINRDGRVVGSSSHKADIPAFHSRAFRWTQGKIHVLEGTSFGGDDVAATGVNAKGWIVGYAGPSEMSASDYYANAFVIRAGEITDLGHGMAFGVNDEGCIVGTSDHGSSLIDDNDAFRAALWIKGEKTEMGEGKAVAVNNCGQVVGMRGNQRVFNSGQEQPHPFIWEKGQLKFLPLLPNSEAAEVAAINDAGLIVGRDYSSWESSASVAALWKASRVYDLNLLLVNLDGWKLTEARGVNNKGWIVGVGEKNGESRGFLLKPIPNERR